MSFEINPVLAGKFDAANYSPATVNASTDSAITGGPSPPDAASPTEDAYGVDNRRYTQFDRTATDAGTATMSFGDFLDMINPLQHIPVVSSVYRAATGDTINPVSRVAGDMLYGGIIGVASAVVGTMGAIANASLEQEAGKDSGGIMLASLFGSDNDKKQNVQLADASSAATPAQTALASVQGSQQNIEATQSASFSPMVAALDVPARAGPTNVQADNAAAQSSSQFAIAGDVSAAPLTAATSASAPPTASPASAADIPGTITLASGKTPGAKQPFGGVMNTANPQAQDMALALSSGTPVTRMGHTIYTSRLMNGAHSLPPMLSSGAGPAVMPVVAPTPTVSLATTADSDSPASAATAANQTAGATLPGVASGLQKNPLPPELVQDMMLKALSQYKNAGMGAQSPGASFNITN